jgi:hypothetical protein
VEVVLLEHFVADEINAGVAAVSSFAATLSSPNPASPNPASPNPASPNPASPNPASPSPEDPELASLRAVFERKAHVAAQERLARALAAADVGDLRSVSLAAAARVAPEEAAAVARRRARLGLESPWAVCDDDGERLSQERLPGWLRFAQTVRVSIDGNAGFCRGLLETRYGLARSGAAGAG